MILNPKMTIMPFQFVFHFFPCPTTTISKHTTQVQATRPPADYMAAGPPASPLMILREPSRLYRPSFSFLPLSPQSITSRLQVIFPHFYDDDLIFPQQRKFGCLSKYLSVSQGSWFFQTKV